MNSAELAQSLINKARNLKTFVVERDIPDNFEFYGRVPFNITASNGKAKFSVIALSAEDAEQEVDYFIQNGTLL
jgi:hypothetical protein